MKMPPISLLWWLITTATLDFLWLETAQGLALEMAAVSLALLMGQLLLVSVSYMTKFLYRIIPYLSYHLPSLAYSF